MPLLQRTSVHGCRKGGEGGIGPTWILKIQKKSRFPSFEWEKPNFTILAAP